MQLPYDFQNNMKKLLKEDYNKYIKSLDLNILKGIRVNSLKISPEDLGVLLKKNLEKVPWCDTGFYYEDDFKASKNFYYNAGLYYIQEPSAMAVGSLIKIEDGDKVLDICAAPGGKTTHIASKLKNRGLIVSNDISSSRCKALIKNIELMGIKNFCVLSETPKNLYEAFGKFFNKIIIDAPCSGEGMFRKDSKVIKSWSLENIEKFHLIQKEILYFASKMLLEGGIISYSTCTFNLRENENTILEFLKENENFSLLNIEHEKYKLSEGFFEKNCDYNLKKCARILPYKNKGEGHFIAILKKDYEKDYEKNSCSNVKKENKKEKCKNINCLKKELKIFEDFCKENLNYKEDYNLILHKDSLLKVSELLPNLNGFRVIRSGWHIGFIKNNRFEPSQSFAMGLEKKQVKNIVTLDESNIIKYLKGESFFIENAKDGWNLVCLGKFPVGWGKVLNGRVKNKYLRSWIIN